MNKYCILYVKGSEGVKYVEADTVNGFKPSSDNYVFKVGAEVVAVVPKNRVASIQKIKTTADDDL